MSVHQSEQETPPNTHDCAKDVTFVGVFMFHAEVGEYSRFVLSYGVAEARVRNQNESEVLSLSGHTSAYVLHERIRLDERGRVMVCRRVRVAHNLPSKHVSKERGKRMI